MSTRHLAALSLCLAGALLGGCEQLGIPDPAKLAAEQAAEGKAVGAGCRHAGRSLEDCYGLNEEAHKASVFAGWKEMNDYMAANNIASIPPQMAQPDTAPATADGPAHKDGKIAASHGEAESGASRSPKH